MHKSKFPLDETILNNIIKDHEVDLNDIGIRELKRLVDDLSDQYKVDFQHFNLVFPEYPPIDWVLKRKSEYLVKIRNCLQLTHHSMASHVLRKLRRAL